MRVDGGASQHPGGERPGVEEIATEIEVDGYGCTGAGIYFRECV